MATRPKLEIVRTENGVSFYLDGKSLDEVAPTRNPCYAAEAIAKALAEALGAEVVNADEPSRQPYTYFISYFGIESGTREARPGNCWMKRSTDIESGADTDEIAEAIMADLNGRGEPFRRVSRVIVSGFTCTDGPY